MPYSPGDLRLGSNRPDQLAFHELPKLERASQAAGSHIIVVLLVLDPESDPRHLFDAAVHELEAGGQRKIAENFPVVDEERVALVSGIPRELSNHGLPGWRGRLRGERLHQWHLGIIHDLPVARLAGTGQGAAEPG